ncbi:penicillin-binding protein [Hoyosella rhizosphaerae]|uniref:Penicillin-binding protein n=1 Tax=Hoyosella rhizosphaerae TaxID=1755582 RepID=A0A916U8P6_9ACTN|nr:penicillin-binding transpeptidase domain-containing protein [Hoyosella rhizosphaerae]MBN4927549.1 penicillin-binding protein [Hoyosella rhizosphaerae]GGC63594.1 penicillin-binding protein [Hoyosella rhizosphaerae]
MRAPHRLLLASVLTLIMVATSSCALFTNESHDTLRAFADAIKVGDVDAAAALTTDPATAAVDIQSTLDGLGTTPTTVSVGLDSSVLELVAVWELGSGRFLETQGTAEFADTANGLRIQWSPKVLDKRLEPNGHLLFAELLDRETPVVDRNGGEVMTWQTVTTISLNPSAIDSADAVAALVSNAAPSVTGASIREEMSALNDRDYIVVALRESDFAPIRDELSAIDGVGLSEHGQLLNVDRSLTSPALRELPEAWEEILHDHKGWSVSAVNPGETIVITGGEPLEITDVPTSLDLQIQQAALDAVSSEEQPATIVAIDPSTGGVLAVAQNSAADTQGPIALTGLYAPGSTFKIVTTSAAINAGITSPDDIVPCPGEATIEGRVIPNDSGFDLGNVPLHTAFARSCNTTQGLLAVQLTANALPATAVSLGLGVDYEIPGLTTVTGRIPTTDVGAARVEAAIGQGQVLASPFGMAVAVASLANDGRTITPTFLENTETHSDDSPTPLPPDVADAIRDMMRETVTSGTATALNDIAGLVGKTGTAEVDGAASNGWFVGIVDGMAFATFVEGAQSSAPAIAASGRFLRAITD